MGNQELSEKIEELIKKVTELDTKQRLFLDAITSLILDVSPDHDSLPYFSLLRDFSTKEINSLESLLNQTAFEVTFKQKNISKEEFEERFNSIFPEGDKYLLLSVVRALNAEGKHSYLSNLFLND